MNRRPTVWKTFSMLQVVGVSNCVIFACRYLSDVSFDLRNGAAVRGRHCQLSPSEWVPFGALNGGIMLLFGS